MPKLICALLASLWTALTFAVAAQPSPDTRAVAAAKRGVPDSKQIEKDLQRLSWKQFRSVVEAIPKLKAGVDAYGPVGWQYVQANYTTYPWRQNVDKLDDAQKKGLADLIRVAKGTR